MPKVSKAFIFVGFLFYPLYMLPWVVKSMSENEYFGYILFSLFMGYLAYLTIPYDTWDITRHYAIFVQMTNLDFSEVFSHSRRFNYMFNLYMWGVSHVGLNKEFVPFSITFIVYFLYFLSVHNIVIWAKSSFDKTLIINQWFLLLGLFLLFNEVRFISVSSGLRNDLAFAIFIFAVIGFYLNHKKLTTLVLTILSLSIHFSVFPLLVMFVLSNLIQIKKGMWVWIVLGFIVMLFNLSEIIFYTLIDTFKPFLKANGLYIATYMDPHGAWGGGFYLDKNIKTVILEKVIKPLPFYVVGLYLLFEREIIFYKIQNYLYLLFFFISIMSISRTFFDRYTYFFVLLFLFLFLLELRNKPLNTYKKIFIGLLTSTILLMDFGGLVKDRDIYVRSWHKILYVPAPYLFLEEVSKDEYIKRKSL